MWSPTDTPREMMLPRRSRSMRCGGGRGVRHKRVEQVGGAVGGDAARVERHTLEGGVDAQRFGEGDGAVVADRVLPQPERRELRVRLQPLREPRAVPDSFASFLASVRTSSVVHVLPDSQPAAAASSDARNARDSIVRRMRIALWQCGRRGGCRVSVKRSPSALVHGAALVRALTSRNLRELRA